MAFFETITKIQQAPRRTRKAIVVICTAIFAILIGGIWRLELKNFDASDYAATKNEIMGPLEMLWQSVGKINLISN